MPGRIILTEPTQLLCKFLVRCRKGIGLVDEFHIHTGLPENEHKFSPKILLPVQKAHNLPETGRQQIIDIIAAFCQFRVAQHAKRHQQLLPFTGRLLPGLSQCYILQGQLTILAAFQPVTVNIKFLRYPAPLLMAQFCPPGKTPLRRKSIGHISQGLNKFLIKRSLTIVGKLVAKQPRHSLSL